MTCDNQSGCVSFAVEGSSDSVGTGSVGVCRVDCNVDVGVGTCVGSSYCPIVAE